jgi:hypothetical protein
MRTARIDIHEASVAALRWPPLCVVTGRPVSGPTDVPLLAITARATPELALPLIPQYAKRMRRSVRAWRFIVRVSLPAALILGLGALGLIVAGVAGIVGSAPTGGAIALFAGVFLIIAGVLQFNVLTLAFLFTVKAQHPRRWRHHAVIQKAHPAFAAEFARLNGSVPGVLIR